MPNFSLIKSTFDFIDLRKDGIIDYSEWNKAFSMVNGKLDLAYEKFATDVKELDYIKNAKSELRMWENSDDITRKYMLIFKNRKLIKNKLVDNNFIINKFGKKYVTSDTLIYVIKKMFPNIKLSNIQWKMITNIGKNEGNNDLINISDFFKLVEINAKKDMFSNNFKPLKSHTNFNQIHYGNFDIMKRRKTNNSKRNDINNNLNRTLNSTSFNNPRFRNIKI